MRQEIQGLPAGSKLYFVGIGGISMSGLAELALVNGFEVCGSDTHASEHVEHLQGLGVLVFSEHLAAQVDSCRPDYVVYTAAIPSDNPELARARERGIPCLDRAVFLGLLTESFGRVLNISGTHGKTTTTALCSMLLLASRLNPTVHLGARLKAFGNSTVHSGEPGRLLVSEACEFNNSFLSFRSTTALITNIDLDHLDFFHDLDHIIEAFVGFAKKIEAGGSLVLPYAAPHMEAFCDRLRAARSEDLQLIFFGQEEDYARGMEGYKPEDYPCYTVRKLRWVEGYPQFELLYPDGRSQEVSARVPGLHNVYNIAAAVAAADQEGLNAEVLPRVLAEFTGADGRFTINGYYHGARLVSDYAHHPTACRATLAAARALPHNKLYVVLQPLTFARVKLHFDEYLDCLEAQELGAVIFYEVYSDREQENLGMSSRLLQEAYARRKPGVRSSFVQDYGQLKAELASCLQEGDLVLFLGPEEVRSFGQRLAEEG